jgi:transcriptional regulator with XRE-family HTH domain
MLFGKKLRKLREEKGLILRRVAALLDIDTATLSKIELGDRRAKREYLPILSQLYNVELEELERLWLADKVFGIIEDEVQGLNVLKEAETIYITQKKKSNEIYRK